ncbi:isoflavone reductase family protein [Halenospora varia]|nr:isoflavone reductase family protein [Halenospora varia]
MTESQKPSIAVFGGTGHMGEHDNGNSKVASLEHAGAIVVTYTDQQLVKALSGIDTVVVALSSKGHHTKDMLLEALPRTNVSLYIPSEFGVDHEVHDFSAGLWNSKKEHSAKVKTVMPKLKICRVYCGLFTEDTFIVPYLGLQASSGKFEAVGSADQKISFTSITDLGKAIASLGTMPLDSIPPAIHIASDTISPRAVAELWNASKSTKIVVSEVDLKGFKDAALAADPVNLGACLRFLQGEGKIDHSQLGLGNDNELVNPGQSKWEWTPVEKWVETV